MAETFRNDVRIIRPQVGFQERFLSSPADIVIGGGSAGGGKTFALLLDPVRYLDVDRFGAVIFRRTTKQVSATGGLWDTSSELFPLLNGEPVRSSLEWRFEKGRKKSRINFAHLEHEKDKYSWQGSQIAWIGFDELPHFSETQFFYLASRNRSTCGVPPCIRATCNPDPDSWVARFLEWWIDQETGFPIPERDGVIRYFIRDGANYVWGDSREEVVEKCPHIFERPEFKDMDIKDLVKSVTFIRGGIYGNKELLRSDPSYLANLLSQTPEEKAILLEGNWKIRQDDKALCNFERVNDLFSNKLDEYYRRSDGSFILNADGEKIAKPTEWFITCDPARFGRDFAVIFVWCGLSLRKIVVFTKSKTSEIREAIEALRAEYSIPKSNVLADDDGLGGGVVDEGGYNGFSGGASVLEDPDMIKRGVKENYANLKTQCWYRFAQRVNKAQVAVDENVVIVVDGIEQDEVMAKGRPQKVLDLLKQDLRSFKREKDDHEGKRLMNSKEKQKNILGRSPDFGDSFMMREWFSLRVEIEFDYVQL